MSQVEDLRDDLASRLATVTGVTPDKQWIAEIDRKNISTTKILIAPSEVELSLASRSHRSERYTMAVAVVQGLTAGNEDTETKAGQDKLELVAQQLGLRVGGTTNMMCVTVAHTALTDREQYREDRLYVGVLNLTYLDYA